MKNHDQKSPYYIKSPILGNDVFEKLCAIEGLYFDENEKTEIAKLENTRMTSSQKIQVVLQEILAK